MNYIVWLALIASMQFSDAFKDHVIYSIQPEYGIGDTVINGKPVVKFQVFSKLPQPSLTFCLSTIYVFEDRTFSDVFMACDSRLKGP
jgi:hypothetical protein